MDVCVQWATATPADWEMISDWSGTPYKADPTGATPVTDDLAGWVHALCVQGVTFNGSDHYAVESLSGGGLRVTSWIDDPLNSPDRQATVFEFAPLTPNQYGAWDTWQTIKRYAEGETLNKLNRLGPVSSTGGRVEVFAWPDFVEPIFNVRHGVQVSAALNGSLDSKRSDKRYDSDPWLEGVPDEEIETRDRTRYLRDQARLGRRIPKLGTRTWYCTDTVLATGVHVAITELEMNETGDEGTDTTDVSGNYSAGEDNLEWVFTTPSGEPNDGTWPTGTYTGQFRVTAAGNEISFGWRVADTVTGHLARVDSGLTSDVDTVTQSQGLFSGTGTHAGTASWTPSGSTASDRFEFALAGTRATGGHGNQSFTIALNDATSFGEGPFDGAGSLLAGKLIRGGLLKQGKLVR